MDSILTSIKKLLGITQEYNHFDPELIIHINSVFSILTQMGVGPADGFTIRDDESVWSDFLEEEKKLDMVKSYMYMKVRLLFDPPSSSAVMESFNNQIKEMEWRMYAEMDNIRLSEEGL